MIEELDVESSPDDTEEDAEVKLLAQMLEDFRLCDEREHDNRENYRDDTRFARLSIQWDEDLRKRREKDGRPCLTINKLPPIIRGVVNDARQNKPQIKVLPEDSKADPKTAAVLTGLFRNIEKSSSADIAYDTAVDCAASGGFGYFRINLAYANDDTWDQDIVFEAVPDPLTIFGDPRSLSADSSDWNVAFVTEMIPKAEFERRWPDADPVDFVADKYPTAWRDGDDVMVAEYWTREIGQRLITLLDNGSVVGVEEYEENAEFYQSQLPPVYPQGNPRAVPTYKVTQRIATAAQILETTEWKGKYIPIVPVFGETVILEGKRYLRSLIRDAKDPQVMFNAWRTAATELVALAPKAPFIGRQGAFVTDSEKWANANTTSYAFIEYDGPEAPQRQPFAGVPAGALQEALNAADDIKATTGIYDASLGARSNETSGVAIRERQGQSENSTFHITDNLSRSIEHAGRILLDLTPKVYPVGRVLRILGEDDTVSSIKVGDPNEQPDPQQEQVSEILPIYDLSSGKYDLTVKAGPGFNTRREEARAEMTELVRAVPEAGAILGDLVVKNSDWPGAEEASERLKALYEQRFGGQAQQGQPQPDPAAIMKAQSDAAEAQADLQIKQEQIRIDAYRAETERMTAVHRMQQPTPAPAMPGATG